MARTLSSPPPHTFSLPCSIRTRRQPILWNITCGVGGLRTRSSNMLSLNQICISKLSAGLLHCPGAGLFAYRTVRGLPRVTLDSSGCWVSLRAAALEMKFELKTLAVLFFFFPCAKGGNGAGEEARKHWARRQIDGPGWVGVDGWLDRGSWMGRSERHSES